MDKDMLKVYIVLNNGTIESIYSEDGNMPVVVLNMDAAHNEPGEIRKNIEQWRQHLRNETFTGGTGTLFEIEPWDATELL